MRRVLFWGALALAIFSCNNSGETGTGEDTSTTTTDHTSTGGTTTGAGTDTSMTGGANMNSGNTTGTGGTDTTTNRSDTSRGSGNQR
jgi:hypothetical protein